MTKSAKKSKTSQRFRLIGGKKLIEVRVKNSLQLFDARDPAPFRERDLDDDFVEYIHSSLKELTGSGPLKIVIYIDEKETKELTRQSIQESIAAYYSYQLELHSIELKTFWRKAQVFLIIGLLILVSCLGVAQSLGPDHSGLLGILREGIVIFGWVSIWKPIELILFDWYPIYEKIRFYKRILEMEVDVIFGVSHGIEHGEHEKL